MKKRLELRLPYDLDGDLIISAAKYESTVSDVARAAMILGLRKLRDDANLTGLPIAHWIAALNGKVK